MQSIDTFGLQTSWKFGSRAEQNQVTAINCVDLKRCVCLYSIISKFSHHISGGIKSFFMAFVIYSHKLICFAYIFAFDCLWKMLWVCINVRHFDDANSHKTSRLRLRRNIRTEKKNNNINNIALIYASTNWAIILSKDIFRFEQMICFEFVPLIFSFSRCHFDLMDSLAIFTCVYFVVRLPYVNGNDDFFVVVGVSCEHFSSSMLYYYDSNSMNVTFVRVCEVDRRSMPVSETDYFSNDPTLVRFVINCD